jgi:ankyrin repeat protein
MIAVENDTMDIVNLLLQHYASVNMVHNDGRTALFFATSFPMLYRLIEAGANVNVQNEHGNTLLYELCYQENKQEELILLLERGADPNLANKDGTTPLMRAAMHGHQTYVTLLMKYGANIYMCDHNNDGALMYAIEHAAKNVVEILMEYDIDVNAPNAQGRTPLEALEEVMQYCKETV